MSTPAEIIAPAIDDHGDSTMENLSFASVVRILMYLASDFCPDIAFAVHQCAQFINFTH